jgi:hypothetical protein
MTMLNLDLCDLRHNRSGRLSALALVILLSIAMAWTVVWQRHSELQVEASLASLQPMTLTVVGTNGTQVVLHETEIGNLSAYRAYGGYKNQLGYIRGLGYYTGVRFTTLSDLVGGMHASDTLRVTASDGYTRNFTYSEAVLGEFVTYDPSTGEQVPHNQPLVPIMAYYYNDSDITDGPLRVAIVGPEGLVTDSNCWVKWSVKMEIIAGPVGGLMMPTDKVAVLARIGAYVTVVSIMGFLTMALVVPRRRCIDKKKQ